MTEVDVLFVLNPGKIAILDAADVNSGARLLYLAIVPGRAVVRIGGEAVQVDPRLAHEAVRGLLADKTPYVSQSGRGVYYYKYRVSRHEFDAMRRRLAGTRAAKP